jgi:hypothetical protein
LECESGEALRAHDGFVDPHLNQFALAAWADTLLNTSLFVTAPPSAITLSTATQEVVTDPRLIAISDVQNDNVRLSSKCEPGLRSVRQAVRPAWALAARRVGMPSIQTRAQLFQEPFDGST